MKNYFAILATVFIVACTSMPSHSVNIRDCNKNTVYEQLDCSINNLEAKEKILNSLGNNKRYDYQVWVSNVIVKCENSISNGVMGESISESLQCKHRLYDKRISKLEK